MTRESDIDQMVNILLNPRTSTIQVTPELIKFAEDLARSKKTSEKRNVLNSDSEMIGVIGEYAVCQALGIEMDTKIYYGGDGGRDIKWKTLSIQVKSTTRKIGKDGEMPHLIFYNAERYIAGIYLLMIIKKPQVTFAGWVTKKESIDRCYTASWFPKGINGHTSRSVVPIKSLNDSYYNELFHRAR